MEQKNDVIAMDKVEDFICGELRKEEADGGFHVNSLAEEVKDLEDDLKEAGAREEALQKALSDEVNKTAQAEKDARFEMRKTADVYDIYGVRMAAISGHLTELKEALNSQRQWRDKIALAKRLVDRLCEVVGHCP